MENFSKEYMADFFMNHLDYKTMQQGDLSFLDVPILFNLLTSMKGILFFKKISLPGYR